MFEQDSKAQPLPPNTSPFTRTLLTNIDASGWNSALGTSSGSASNGIQQLNGHGTNTTLVNPTLSGTISGLGSAATIDVPVILANGGTGATTAQSAATNISILLVTGDFLSVLSNTAPKYVGQIAVAHPSVGQMLVAIAASTNVGDWTNSAIYPNGISAIGNGDWKNGLADFGQMHIWLNSTPQNSVRRNVVDTNTGNVRDALVFIHNLAYSADSGICVPMPPTTNANYPGVGGLIGTNADGQALYGFDPWGIALVSTGPDEEVGEPNLAGQYALIWTGGIPFSISANIGRTGDSYTNRTGHVVTTGQPSFMTFDTRNATNGGATPIAISIARQIANVWSFTNNLYQDVMELDLQNGQVSMSNTLVGISNLFVGGWVPDKRYGANGHYLPNVGQFSFGDQSGLDDHNAPFSVNTSGVFSTHQGVWTFDYDKNYHRFGFTIKSGGSPMITAASGLAWNIGHSDAGDLQTTALGSQNLTVDFTGDGHTVTVTNSENLAVQGNVYAASLTSTGPPTFSHTNTAPGNTTTPKLWIDVTNGAVVYKMPLYQ
jgi:hypothetical protein